MSNSIKSNLLALENLFTMAVVGSSSEGIEKARNNYATLMKALVDLEKYETTNKPKIAVLLGGKG